MPPALLTAVDAILHSYAQVLFARSRAVGAVLLVATFVVPAVGLGGLIGAVGAIAIALALGFDRDAIIAGRLSYNGLLTGLVIAATWQPSWTVAAVAPVLALIVVAGHVAIEGGLRYHLRLPALSLPFVLTAWLGSAALARLPGAAVRVVPFAGIPAFHGPVELERLMAAFGAIFAVPNRLAGALVLIALVGWSRVAAVHGLVGYAVARAFLAIVMPVAAPDLAVLGFNGILVAVALGGVLVGLGASETGYLYQVESRRRTVGLQAPEWANVQAQKPARVATSLAPGDGAAWCALAWSEERLGDTPAAAQAFAKAAATGGACAPSPKGGLRGGVWLGGLVAGGKEDWRHGGLAVARVGGPISDTGYAEVTVRGLVTGAGTAGTVGVGEAWGRVGVARHGAELLGGLHDDGGISGVIGGRARVSYGATLRLEGALGRYDDGHGDQLGVSAYVPLASLFAVELSAQREDLTPDSVVFPPPMGAPPVPPAIRGMMSGFAVAHLRASSGADLAIGGRLGSELRPVRFDEPSLWLDDRPALGSALVLLEVPLRGGLDLYVADELYWLRAPIDATASRVDLAAIGLTFPLGGSK